MANHPLYWRWKDMRRRCHQPSYKDYKNYGGRGIKVYEDWYYSFELFALYVEENLGVDIWSRELMFIQIDRIDNDKGYEPGNIRWSTRGSNSVNKRRKVARKMEVEMTEINGLMGFGC